MKWERATYVASQKYCIGRVKRPINAQLLLQAICVCRKAYKAAFLGLRELQA
jgi:hypothetical protein